MILGFDTETEGLVNRKADATHSSQPHLLQLGAILWTKEGRKVSTLDCIIKPVGFEIKPPILPPGVTLAEAKAQRIPFNASDVNGITHERAMDEGIDRELALEIFSHMCQQAELGIAHNADFDILALEAAHHRAEMDHHLPERIVCTMQSTTALCKLEPFRYGSFKWPTLQELHVFLFGEEFTGAHDALTDVDACGRSYFELQRRGHQQWYVLR